MKNAPVLDRPHIRAGRTMKQAREAGNHYVLWSIAPRVRLDFPQATSPTEVLELGRTVFDIPVGTVFVAERVVSESDGCRLVEFVGRIVA